MSTNYAAIPVTDAEDEAFEQIENQHLEKISAAIVGDEQTEDDPPPSPVELEEQYAAMDMLFYATIKPFLDDFKKLREAVVDSHAVGAMWQAPDGTVFQVAEKKGQWVDFFPFEIKRTRREGEKKGTLALTEAKAAGFTISEK